MNIVYSKQATKAINGMDKPTKKRIREGIEKIPAGDISPMEGYTDGSRRLRIGKYRIIFVIKDNTVVVRDIGSRGNIYK